MCKTYKQLTDQIDRFDYEQYLKRVEKFLGEKQFVDDGESAKRIVDWIETLVLVRENKY